MSRKITQQAIKSFINKQSFFKDNTVVEVTETSTTLKLFNNPIAGIDYKGMWISDAGWPTRTTFDRLNGIDGVYVFTKKGQVYLNGFPWDGEKEYVMRTTHYYTDILKVF